MITTGEFSFSGRGIITCKVGGFQVSFGHRTLSSGACEDTKRKKYSVLGSVNVGLTRYMTTLGGGTSITTGYHMLMSCNSLSPCSETFLYTIAGFAALGNRHRAVNESVFSAKTIVVVASCGRNGSKSRLYDTMGDISTLFHSPNRHQNFMPSSSRCDCVEKVMSKDHAVCCLLSCVLLVNPSKVSNRFIGSILAIILK